MKYPPGISNFLEEIPSVSYSITFLCFFSLLIEEGFLLPFHSLELWIQRGISFFFFFFAFSHQEKVPVIANTHFQKHKRRL